MSLSSDELGETIKKLEGLKIVIVIMDDYTTKKYVGVTSENIKNWGLFGFAISNDSMYFWLREGERYMFKKLSDKEFEELNKMFVHHELGDSKLKEWK